MYFGAYWYLLIHFSNILTCDALGPECIVQCLVCEVVTVTWLVSYEVMAAYFHHAMIGSLWSAFIITLFLKHVTSTALATTPDYVRPSNEPSKCECKFPKHTYPDSFMEKIEPLCGKRFVFTNYLLSLSTLVDFYSEIWKNQINEVADAGRASMAASTD